MKTCLIEVDGFGGKYQRLAPCNGEKIEFTEDVGHGDWKTASVFPERWPTIKKGTKCKVIAWMQNLEGVHITVEHAGSEYDIPFRFIKGLK